MKRSWIAVLCALAMLPAAVAIAHPGAQAQEAAGGQSDAIAGNGAPEACSRTLLADFDPNKGEYFGHDVSVWGVGDGSAVMFQSGMTIDADGAPNAYNPDNTGLDDLSNAGEPGDWDGIVADRGGEPFIQGPDDPFPGFYVSCTALVDWSKLRTDPARYVDASKIMMAGLPGHEFPRQTQEF